MSFAKVYSAQTVDLGAHIIDVEIDLAKGLHSFSVVGLADKAVDEARDRMSAAIKNTGFKPPKEHNKKIVISLAPASLKKTGPLFDVPMALAYLLSTEDIDFNPKNKVFIGELSLSGDVRSVYGILPLIQAARNAGFKEAYVPKENAIEAALVSGIKIYGVDTLKSLIAHLDEGENSGRKLPRQAKTNIKYIKAVHSINLDDIRSQDHAKRGLTIAAAGGHNIALYGPPGTGKTMLARAFAGILPKLAPEEILEVTGIHSISGVLKDTLITDPPVRSPHHTASYVSLVGGGTNPKPGEVTLAHRGVLFLDEFPEFDKKVINALRQPLEDGYVSISRAKGTAKFPSNFVLIAAMNPCPCGYFGTNKCSCTHTECIRYKQKISGPIMDRIDMWIEVGAIDHAELSKKRGKVSSEQTTRASTEVAHARAIQSERFKKGGAGRLNAGMSSRGLEYHAELSTEVATLLNKAAKSMALSPRAYHRVIKLARTIADLAGEQNIKDSHILEALSYRPKAEF